MIVGDSDAGDDHVTGSSRESGDEEKSGTDDVKVWYTHRVRLD
jgi:hypothetical protein